VIQQSTCDHHVMQVEIPGTDVETFTAFLQYLYTDHAPIEEGDPAAILVLANQYCVGRLRALCELYISKTIEKATEVSIAKSDVDFIGMCLCTIKFSVQLYYAFINLLFH